MKKDLFKLMEEYSLTLRRLPYKVASSYSYRSYMGLPNEEIYEVVLCEKTKQTFELMKSKGCFTDCRWEDGKVIRKMVRKTSKREGGWIVKINSGYDSIQQWDRRYDFFGKTPEEAIMKAVESITDKTKQDDKRRI